MQNRQADSVALTESTLLQNGPYYIFDAIPDGSHENLVSERSEPNIWEISPELEAYRTQFAGLAIGI